MKFLLMIFPPESVQILMSDAGISARYVTVIDGIAFYRSTGQNSGASRLWFPFNGFQVFPPFFHKPAEVSHVKNMGDKLGGFLQSLPNDMSTYQFFRFGNPITLIYSIALNELVDPSTIGHYQVTFDRLTGQFPEIRRAIETAKIFIEQSVTPLQQLRNPVLIPKKDLSVHDMRELENQKDLLRKQYAFTYDKYIELYQPIITRLNQWLLEQGGLWGGDAQTNPAIPTFAELAEQMDRHPHWQYLWTLISSSATPLSCPSSSSSSSAFLGGVGIGDPSEISLPEWELNTPDCQICHKHFNFFIRRHHCRSCGRCICVHCCKKKHFFICHYCLAIGANQQLVHRPYDSRF